MDRLAAMQAFVRVVEAGSFTKAADSLQLPKPTVSRLVQSLEASVQTKLLNRTTRRVTLTAEGAVYFDRVLQLLGELDELESNMNRAKANPRGRLRIDVPAALGRVVLIPALPDFHARYPEIQIDLGVSDRPADLIAETVDCVVRAGEIADQSLVARRIGEFRTVLCASPAYLKRYGMPRHPRELENSAHHIVGFSSRHSGRPYLLRLQRNGEETEIAARHIVSADDATACLLGSVAGLGIVHTATFMAAPHIATGALVPLLQGWCERPIPLYVAYPPSRHLSAKLRAFVDWVAALFSNSSLSS